MTSRRFAAALALVLLLASAGAAADPEPTHVATEEPRLLCVPPLAVDARCRDLPPGHFVDGATWSRLDAELRRAHDAETRLAAENKSLRGAVSGWQPGWKTLAVALAAGIAGGVYVHSKF